MSQKSLTIIILSGLVIVASVVGFVFFRLSAKQNIAANRVVAPITSPTSPTITPDQVASAEERPPAPAGFTWQECKGMKAAFLKPEGWFFREESHGDSEACFITKEEIVGEKGQFETGLSVNAVRNIPKKTGVLPTTYIQKMATGDANGTIKHRTKSNAIAVGPVKGFWQIIEAQNPGDVEPLRMYFSALGNDKTGVAYILTFETPSKNWSANQEMVQTVMSVFALDDEF